MVVRAACARARTTLGSVPAEIQDTVRRHDLAMASLRRRQQTMIGRSTSYNPSVDFAGAMPFSFAVGSEVRAFFVNQLEQACSSFGSIMRHSADPWYAAMRHLAARHHHPSHRAPSPDSRPDP